jgi:hypothetical protein
MNLNIENMKALKKPNSDVVTATETLLLAQAWVDTVKPIVTAYQIKVLASMNARTEKQHRKYDDYIILDPERTYLMGEDDFQTYITLTRIEQDKAGLVTESRDFCPLLVAESLLSDAQNALVDILEPITGLSAHLLICNGMKVYRQYLEICLSWLARFVDSQKALNSITS